MSATLRNIRLTSIDLVREGANPEAAICLFKSSNPPVLSPWPSWSGSGRPNKLAYQMSRRFDWIVEVTRV